MSRSAIGFFVAVGIMNASNVAFHVMASRWMGPGEYGALSSLLAVLFVLSVPLNTLQTAVAKRTTELRAEGRELEIASLSFAAVRVLGPMAVLTCVGLALVAPIVGAFLHVGLGSVALLGVFSLTSVVLAAPLGALQGMKKFWAMAGVLLAGVVTRLVVGFLLFRAGWGIEGALAATALAPAVSLVLAQRVLRRIGARQGGQPESWSITLLRGEFRQALLGLGAFWLMAGIDVVLARHYLGPEQAGFYASAGMIAKAMLFLPGAISTIAFPRFVEAARDDGEAGRWLRQSVGAVVLISVVTLPVLVIFRTEAVRLAFGHGFAPAADLVPVLAVAMSLLAIANVLVYFCIARGVRAHVIVLPGVALEVALVALFHHDPRQVTIAMVTVSAAVTVGLWLAARAATRPIVGGADDRSDEPLIGVAPGPAVPPRLTVVLPCKDGADALHDVLAQTVDVLDPLTTFEVIVVSDGSTDRTEEIASTYPDERVRLLAYRRPRGKGHAVRVGCAAARGRYVAFMDSDGDIEPQAFASFLPLVDLYDPDAVIGSKRHPLSQVEYPCLRRVLSSTFRMLTNALFRLRVRDTQTGIKLFRRDVLVDVLPRLRDDGYTFDLELLVVARQLGYTRVFEAPVRIGYRSASTIGVRTPLRMLAATVALFVRRYVLDAYRDAGAGVGLPVVDSPAATFGPSAAVVPPGEDPLRILVVNWRDVANPEAGGAEAFTHEVTRRWAAWGHEITLLTSRFRGGRPTETIDGVQIRRVGALRRGSFHLLVQRELSRLRGYDVLIDEINTLPFLSPLWSETLPPIVGLIHQLAEDVWDAEMPRPVAAIGRRAEPRMLRMYRNVPVVTISGSTSSDLQRLGFRDVRLVLQGRDEPPVISAEKEPIPTFLFVGRLTANKRPDHAIEAFRTARGAIPEARLWIVGDGPMRDALRARVEPGVEVLGRVPRDELYERMARAHCLLVPSVREGWGLVITEANAVGTPAVGYAVAGIRDAIRDTRTGLLVAPGDPEALGRAAADLLLDPKRYAQMRIEAERWGTCFSWDLTAELFLEIVKERARAGRADRMEAVGAGLAATG